MSKKIPMDPMPVQWDSDPPDSSKRHMHVCTPRPSVPVYAMSVAPAAIGCYVHWFLDPAMKGKGRTVPHIDPIDRCYCCTVQNQKPRWHGYLAAWHPRWYRHVILDISLNAAQSCPALIPSNNVDLTGCMVLLKRIGTSPNSPVIAEVEPRRIDLDKLPATFDIKRSLCRLWGCHDDGGWRLDDLDGPYHAKATRA